MADTVKGVDSSPKKQLRKAQVPLSFLKWQNIGQQVFHFALFLFQK